MECMDHCGSAVLLTHTLLFLQPVKQLFAWEALFVQRQTSPMAANHTAMFEVLYQVRQLISLTHKICQGRNMPSHTKMHIFTPKSATYTDTGQVAAKHWHEDDDDDDGDVYSVPSDRWFAEKQVSLIKPCLKLALSPEPIIFNQSNYTSKLQVNLWITNAPPWSVLWRWKILLPPSVSPVVLSDWSSSGSGGASAGMGSSLTRFTSLWSSSAPCGSETNTKAQPWTPVRIPILFLGNYAPSHQFLEIIIAPNMDTVKEDLRDGTASRQFLHPRSQLWMPTNINITHWYC